jgi:hypothetical protein
MVCTVAQPATAVKIVLVSSLAGRDAERSGVVRHGPEHLEWVIPLRQAATEPAGDR